MANNIYRVDILAAGPDLVTVTDDGIGVDWLVLAGVYADATDIRLNYTNSLISESASGLFYSPGVTHRLVVNGLIENVRGSDSRDAIAGNEANNLLFGDQTSDGVGGNDTIGGGDGKDSVYGGAGDDDINGGAGNDLLFGDAGNDSISGSYDADTIEGGLGADSLAGGQNAGDTVSYAHSSAAVSLDITFGTFTTGHGGDADGDQVIGFFDVIGSRFDDTFTDTVKTAIAFGQSDSKFYGGGGSDHLTLGAGNDLGDGGTGNDVIVGETGNDSLLGGSGDDTLTAGDGNDVVDGGAGKDLLSGDAGTDKLIGGTGNDTLNGGAGADRLIGGAGADVLTGGTVKADVFVFNAWGDSTAVVAGRDSIMDFSHTQADKIDLHLIDAVPSSSATNEIFHFIGSVAFSGAAGELRFQLVTGGVLVQANRDTDHDADFSIFVAGVTNLVAADFNL